MGHQRIVSSERERLEAYIGNADLIPRPTDLFTDVWDAHVQADAIVTRVKYSLRFAAGVLHSTTDDTAALEFNKSALGYPLRESSNHVALLTATRILASEAGVNTNDVQIYKKHGPLSAVFGPTIYVVLPDADTAQKLINHIRPPVSQAIQPS